MVLKTKKVLIVDDELADLGSARKLLEKEGFDVETADNGASALDILRKKKFNLILLDIKLPTLSGYDLARMIREKMDCSIKLIYFTIVPKSELAFKEVDGFIQKPYSEKSFLKEVKRVLK